MAKKNVNIVEEPLEKQLWKTADKLRKNIDAAEYKHIALGLIFLKYIYDAFEELYAKLKEEEINGADPEDIDEYKAENVFFVPKEARWEFLKSQAKQPTIGKTVDAAMDAIEKENSSLKGVLPKVFARQNLDPTSLGELIDLLRNDGRWQYGTPPVGNANFAWLQHFIYHLSPNGQAGVVLAKGALTSKTSGEGEIRKALIEAGLIDCIVNFPAKLFLNTQIPAALWFLSRNRNNGTFRNRSKEILFIDARNLGHLINRRTRELSNGSENPEDNDIAKISDTYHNWRNPEGQYEDIPGFCASIPIERVAELDYVLTPGRYVGLPEEDDDFDFNERFTALRAEFDAQLQEEAELNRMIAENLAKIKLE